MVKLIIPPFVGVRRYKSNLVLFILLIADIGFWRYCRPPSFRSRLVGSTVRQYCCCFKPSSVLRCERGLHWHLWQPYSE